MLMIMKLLIEMISLIVCAHCGPSWKWN